MKAADVMVSNVITVGLDASIGEVAATRENRPWKVPPGCIAPGS